MSEHDDIINFVRAIAPESGSKLKMQYGTVVDTSFGCAVTVEGGSAVVPFIRWLDSYTPVVGDEVVMLAQGADKIIIGRLQ